ncbi:MAG TPA: hypothetical protein PLF72_00970, partial [Anaerolineaceae bacterium]|nr:hypothetical protein [Anaerolineaceae bacterium]
MPSIKNWLTRQFSPGLKPPKAGLYHYDHQQNGSRSRIHLRVEADRRGILLVNASHIYHLNPSATLMAYLFLQESTLQQ